MRATICFKPYGTVTFSSEPSALVRKMPDSAGADAGAVKCLAGPLVTVHVPSDFCREMPPRVNNPKPFCHGVHGPPDLRERWVETSRGNKIFLGLFLALFIFLRVFWRAVIGRGTRGDRGQFRGGVAEELFELR